MPCRLHAYNAIILKNFHNFLFILDLVNLLLLNLNMWLNLVSSILSLIIDVTYQFGLVLIHSLDCKKLLSLLVDDLPHFTYCPFSQHFPELVVGCTLVLYFGERGTLRFLCPRGQTSILLNYFRDLPSKKIYLLSNCVYILSLISMVIS